MNYSKEDLIKYRTAKAFETLEVAKHLAKGNYWNSVANRLYYSCFYIILAVFVKEGINATTHAGVRTQLGKNFVKPQRLSIENGRFYSNLFDKRQESDYQDFVVFTAEEIFPLISETESFLNLVKDKFLSN